MSGLRDVRISAGYNTGKELADEAGIPAATYARWERNPMGIPPERACAIADVLCCTLDEIYGHGGSNIVVGRQQGIYNALSPVGKVLVDEFLDFQQHRDEMRGLIA